MEFYIGYGPRGGKTDAPRFRNRRGLAQPDRHRGGGHHPENIRSVYSVGCDIVMHNGRPAMLLDDNLDR